MLLENSHRVTALQSENRLLQNLKNRGGGRGGEAGAVLFCFQNNKKKNSSCNTNITNVSQQHEKKIQRDLNKNVILVYTVY